MPELVVISDFDGTISEQDINDAVYNHFGDEITQQIEKKYRSCKIGDKEALVSHYRRLNLTEDKLCEFIKNNITIDPGFKHFYNFVKENKINFSIVSGGFSNYINFLFSKEDIIFKHPIYANKMKIMQSKVMIDFLHSIDNCQLPYGPCGNCKYKVISEYKKKCQYIIYIGDGLTDRCAVNEVDLVMAKKESYLEGYCLNNKLSYLSFGNFFDVKAVVKSYI